MAPSSSVCSKCGRLSDEIEDGTCLACRGTEAATIAPDESATESPTLIGKEQDGEGELPPKTFGEYELIEEIARGGMGVVYKARHRRLNRVAALKMILGGRFSSEEELHRFHIEAQAAARLDHPGIVPVYEIGESDGQAFFAMKYIEGGSLAEQIGNYTADSRRAAKLMAAVARSVHHAHQRGILHRDLKPANILIDEHGCPLVTDLGLAKNTTGDSDLTHTGAVLGTPSYMPPEQAAGDTSITTAADIYSLGAILYELITGRPPYKEKTPIETVMRVLDSAVELPQKRNPMVDRDLELICLRCLERDPESRYASAADLAADLERWLAGESISIRAPSLAAVAGRWLRQNRRMVYLGFAICAGLVISAPFALLLLTQDSDLGEVYSYFPAEQRPWLFSIGKVPTSISTAAVFLLFFVFWPSIGFLNGAIARPRTVTRAFGTGLITSMVLSSVFFLLMGWLVFVQGANNVSREKIRVLTAAVWQPTGQDRNDALQKANAMFGGLEHIPEGERAEVVAKRIVNDQLAGGPSFLLILLGVGLVFSVPIVYGTVFAHLLLQHKGWYWLILLRYTVAWWTAGLTLIMILITCLPVIRISGNPSTDYVVILIGLIILGMAITYASVCGWRFGRDKHVEPSSAVT